MAFQEHKKCMHAQNNKRCRITLTCGGVRFLTPQADMRILFRCKRNEINQESLADAKVHARDSEIDGKVN